MFQLDEAEWEGISSQFVMTSRLKRPKAFSPFAFTEHGVIMLSSVLRSPVAIQTSVEISRAFVAMRNYIMTNRQVTAELLEIRARLDLLERNDEENMEALNDLSEDMRKEIDNIYQAIAALSVRSAVPDSPRKKIGFGQKQASGGFWAAACRMQPDVPACAVRGNIGFILLPYLSRSMCKFWFLPELQCIPDR